MKKVYTLFISVVKHPVEEVGIFTKQKSHLKKEFPILQNILQWEFEWELKWGFKMLEF